MTKVHFIAIGGSVMHQLAIALHKKGYQVTGSDDEIFEPAASNLAAEGILPAAIGWFPERITPDLDAIILGMHARADNPELLQAQQLGLKIYSFPEYIYQESLHKKRIAIGGSHGKTTTTAMIMHVLHKIGKAFDYLVGARLEGFSQSVNITDAPVIVCEADEYPASTLEKRPKFHFLHPHISVLTGIAWDHINVFPTFEIYKEQFAIFIRTMEAGGTLIYNNADETLRQLVEKEGTHLKLVPYNTPIHMIREGVTRIFFEEGFADLQVFGEHNLLNMHAAKLVCNELGIDDETFLGAIADFTGAAKRLEVVAKTAGSVIFRDFAHAPSKVKATIQATQHQFPDRKLIGVLELHTYSSLNKDFLHEYAGAMDKADVPVVYFSKHALELKRLPDLDPTGIKVGFENERLQVISDKDALQAFLDKQDYRNTTLLLMSSGTYDGLDIAALKNKLH